MGLRNWIRLPFDRIGPNLKVLFQGDENELLEDDPIGEFLSMKAVGTLLTEDNEGTIEVEVAEEPHDLAIDHGHAEIHEPSMVNIQQDLDEKEPGKEELLVTPTRVNEGQTDQIGYEATSIDMAEDDGPKTLAAGDDAEDVVESTVADLRNGNSESPEIDALIETSGDHQTAEVLSLDIAEEGQPQAEKPQEEGETDSLLDVFKDVQLEDNPISILARDLDDTDVHSLLEETKQIADRVKKSSE
ncbi:MAG: hypothetical protein JSW38_11915 [Dehalococcoidia bacterium]|nr:MAG: hypothetical protein JSW38_11915 [Dehalococcoidia bacterium]